MMMFDWSIPFIGREEELATIGAALEEFGARRIIFLWGEGGIGKTRLLHEIESRFAASPQVKILPVIDFDDDQYKFPQNVSITIGRQLDPIAFDPYLEALRKMRVLEEKKSDEAEISVLLRRQALTVNRFFVQCFNDVARQRRIILRIDTTDALRDAVLLEYLHEIVAQLTNVLVLIAGRDVDQWHQKYQANLGDEAVLLPLRPFTLSNSRAYLDQKQQLLKMTLDQEWMDKLFILAGGLPVLIDLAIESAQELRPIPWLEQKSLAELQAIEIGCQLDELREEFKKAVVMPTANLDSRFDQLKLVLAKVYPLDAEGVMEMLNLSQEDTLRLLNQARRSVAIKNLPDGRLKLHDEIQRLINLHVWPALDQNREWELRDSRRAIAYLYRKSEALLEDIRQLRAQELEQIDAIEPERILDLFGERREKEGTFWSLRLDLLRRQLAIDVQAGYDLFQHDQELSRQEVSYRQGLLTVISPYADFTNPLADLRGNRLTEEQRQAIQQERALQARFNGMYQQAADIYQQLLQKIPPDSENYIETLNGQANQLVRIGKLQEAIGLNEQALALSQTLNSQKWSIQSHLELGWIYRLMGHLGQAQQYYARALKLAYAFDDEERIALIYNNIAYVHALEHQEKAFDVIEQAIRLWRNLTKAREENRFRLGQCYNIAGEISLEMGRPEQSLTYFELSWNIFSQEEREQTWGQKVSIAEWSSKARSGRGFAYWQLAVAALRKREREAAQRYLQDAQFDLEWAEERCTDVDSPVILQRLGEVYFLLQNYPAAEKTWKQGMKEAEQIGDALHEFRNMSSLARLTFYHPTEGFSSWQDFERWYKFEYRRRYQVHFQNLVSLFYTYLGHLALRSQDISNAMILYQRGLPPLAETIAYHPFTLTDQLDFVETEILPHLSHDTVRQFGKSLQNYWLEGMYDMIALKYFREWSLWKGSERKRTGGIYV